VLTCSIGATGVLVTAIDLAGTVLTERRGLLDISAGPSSVLGACAGLIERLIDDLGDQPWGVGVSVPGPVDIDAGIVVNPPIMAGWDRFPIRDWMAEKLNAAVWLDNDANAAALGELRHGLGRASQERSAGELVYVHLGTGIGSGIVMGGRLQRGALGCAGDVGHLPSPGATAPCPCGNSGCLEAVAGGAALGRVARSLAEDGRSPALSEMAAALPDGQQLDAADLSRAAERGDAAALNALRTAGTQIGEVLAFVVSLLNPGQLILGGGLALSGDLMLSAVRQSLYARALPLASRDLLVRRTSLNELGSAHGLAELVIDGLFTPEVLDSWTEHGSPRGMPNLSNDGMLQRVPLRH
jgi:predicted NBD/HSP70 family sugar kinase